MEEKSFLKNTQIFLLGICIALATIVSSVIISKTFVQVKKFTSEVITVTGSAERNIVSDYAVWRSSFSRRNLDLKSAYSDLKGDLEKVKKYFLAEGVQESKIIITQAQTEILYQKNEKGNDTNTIEAYKLTQSVEIKSYDVKQIDEISRKSTELIDQGIEFISSSPEYFYSKLTDLKVEMIAKASENAKQRADKMANATGNHIGFMRSAKMGVFQITPANSYEISDWGTNDTSSLEKKVTAVVNATFAIVG